MKKIWTIVLVAVLAIGTGFLVGCTNSCDTCGGEIVSDPCTCGSAPVGPSAAPGGSCGGGGSA